MNATRPMTHLYIVDDSATMRTRIHEVLDPMPGVRVVGEAADAPRAVVDILSLAPHVVVLDLDLHGSSGMQVLHAIVPQMPAIDFVVLTSHSDPQYRRACQRAGARHFLDKATEFDRIRQVVSECAQMHH